MKKGVQLIRSVAEADALFAQVHASATQLRKWISAFPGDDLELLRALKFDQVGRHPVDGHALNAIEQVNQVWTYLVALAAARQLLLMHADAGGMLIAPGAHAAQPLDVMSEATGLVGAETFASVDPANNRKLANDLAKLADRPEQHRYVFFASPKFPGFQRLPQLERASAAGVQVWSVDV